MGCRVDLLDISGYGVMPSEGSNCVDGFKQTLVLKYKKSE